MAYGKKSSKVDDIINDKKEEVVATIDNPEAAMWKNVMDGQKVQIKQLEEQLTVYKEFYACAVAKYQALSTAIEL